MGASVGARRGRVVQFSGDVGSRRDRGDRGDLEPSTLIAAYAQGIFPMKVEDVLAWWSPDRAASCRSTAFGSAGRCGVRSSVRDRVDTAFPAVMRVRRPRRRTAGSTTTSSAYCRLHDLGWAHSIEAWHGEVLAGGVYGVRVAGLFAGESMFHRVTDASKVALWGAVELLRMDGVTLFDVQWTTPHLESLGAVDVSRAEYSLLLDAAVGSRDG
jgi:leucyl/phenylalanyl-tRNA--protein transferase